MYALLNEFALEVLTTELVGARFKSNFINRLHRICNITIETVGADQANMITGSAKQDRIRIEWFHKQLGDMSDIHFEVEDICATFSAYKGADERLNPDDDLYPEWSKHVGVPESEIRGN